MEVCFLMVEKAPFGVCYDCYTWAVRGRSGMESRSVCLSKGILFWGNRQDKTDTILVIIFGKFIKKLMCKFVLALIRRYMVI